MQISGLAKSKFLAGIFLVEKAFLVQSIKNKNDTSVSVNKKCYINVAPLEFFQGLSNFMKIISHLSTLMKIKAVPFGSLKWLTEPLPVVLVLYQDAFRVYATPKICQLFYRSTPRSSFIYT